MKRDKSTRPAALTRRELLACTALGGLAMAMPPVLLGQPALQSVTLGDNLHLVTGAGCNVLVAVGPNEVLVVDGGLRDASAALLQTIATLAGGKPVTTLFNTNWRPEHCGLNYELGPAGASIIAHENTRLWQNNDFTVPWEDTHYRPMPARAQANATFYKTGSLQLGGETVEYGRISEFHTDGDMYVYFREADVLAAGDMVTAGTYPLLDYITGGWIGGAQKSIAGLLAMTGAQTRVIPAAGPMLGRNQLEVEQQMLDLAYAKVADAYKTGRSLDQFMAADPMADYDGIYGDSALFVELLYRGTWYHVPGRAIQGII